MSLDFDAILEEASEQERTVPLLLNGALRARWDGLAHALELASPKAVSLGEPAPAIAIAREMDDLREQIKAAEVPFRLRAIHPREWLKYMDTRPERAADQSDSEWADIWHLWVCQGVAATCVDPVMTGEQVDQLCAKLSSAQWVELSNVAFRVNNDREQVPFSAAASVLTLNGDGMLKQPETPESPSPDS